MLRGLVVTNRRCDRNDAGRHGYLPGGVGHDLDQDRQNLGPVCVILVVSAFQKGVRHHRDHSDRVRNPKDLAILVLDLAGGEPEVLYLELLVPMVLGDLVGGEPEVLCLELLVPMVLGDLVGPG
jgi:hypothetical protein